MLYILHMYTHTHIHTADRQTDRQTDSIRRERHTDTYIYTYIHRCRDTIKKREFGLRGQGSITWLKRRQFTVTRFLD
jgi:hypothetical protein